MTPYNRLTPAQAELLAMLAEEAAEIIQDVGKILRFGFENSDPSKVKGPSNRLLLEAELADLEAVRQLLCEAGDITNPEQATLDRARDRKLFYSHHQRPPVVIPCQDPLSTEFFRSMIGEAD